MNIDVREEREVGMRRVFAVAAVLLAAIAVLLVPTPASAQVPPGSQATPLVGSGIVANCPPGSPGAVASGTATINGVTVGFPAGGRCVPLSADAEGSYTVAGSFTSPLPFTAECHNAGGVVQSRSGVTVPAGTIVNGVAVAVPTVVETPNAAVIFPGGRTAILNQTITTPTSVTVNAIVFTGGPIVGQVVCGAAVYPLAVDVSGVADAVLPLAEQALPGGDSGPGAGLLLLGALGVLAVAGAQVAVARRLRRGSAIA